MRYSSAVPESKPLLVGRARVFGFGMWNSKLEGTLTLTAEQLRFCRADAESQVIALDSILAVEAGAFRMGGTPILRVLHSDNVVWAVSVDTPEEWERSILDLALHTRPQRDVPKSSKGLRLVTGMLLLIVLLVSLAVPVITSLTQSRINESPQEYGE